MREAGEDGDGVPDPPVAWASLSALVWRRRGWEVSLQVGTVGRAAGSRDPPPEPCFSLPGHSLVAASLPFSCVKVRFLGAGRGCRGFFFTLRRSRAAQPRQSLTWAPGGASECARLPWAVSCSAARRPEPPPPPHALLTTWHAAARLICLVSEVPGAVALALSNPPTSRPDTVLGDEAAGASRQLQSTCFVAGVPVARLASPEVLTWQGLVARQWGSPATGPLPGWGRQAARGAPFPPIRVFPGTPAPPSSCRGGCV